MFNGIRKSFVTGFAVVLPLIITVWLIRLVVSTTNLTLLEPIIKFLRPYIPDSGILEYAAKILLVIFIILAVALIGLGTRLLFLRSFFSYWEKKLRQIPMIGTIYRATKDMSYAFLGQSKGIFTRVVLVNFPHKGAYAIGFVTSEGKGEVQNKTTEKVINVFVPTTPNPTSGFLLLVPKEEMIDLDMSIEEGLKLVISGGIVPLPDRVNIKKNMDGDTNH